MIYIIAPKARYLQPSDVIEKGPGGQKRHPLYVTYHLCLIGLNGI